MSGEDEQREGAGSNENENENISPRASLTQIPSNYGSITPSQSSSSQPQPSTSTYVPIMDRDTQRRGSRVPESPAQRSDFGLSPQSTPISPFTTIKAKRPGNTRRASTKRQLPHRGQEFSVDDDAEEFEALKNPLTPFPGTLVGSRRPDATVRRRTAAQITPLPRLDSEEEDTIVQTKVSRDTAAEAREEMAVDGQNDDEEIEDVDGDDDDGDISDTESFTLKDRQLAINETHPFGIRIWKPALYKKNRSVEKTAEEDIHSSPSQSVGAGLWLFNILWTLLFGWWLAIACVVSALVCFVFSIDSSAREYGHVCWSLAGYLFFPFGQFVKLESDENYAEEDEGEGRSISEYERWQTGDLEHGRLFFGPQTSNSIIGRRRNSLDSASERDSLLGRPTRPDSEDANGAQNKRRIFGRGQWTLGRVIFFGIFYFLIAPLMLLVSGVCWMLIFWIPMARVLSILMSHLRRHPLALSFHPDATFARNSTAPSSVLLCTYRAVGSKYWKYTVDGTNVLLINLLGIVAFVIFDYFVLAEGFGLKIWLTGPALLFFLSLLSVIPLAYFIGQAVASISAQSSMGMGAAVNAFFSTIVEVYLYCVALNEGKGKLVEGSIIGSIFAGILFLPGLSMCFGAIRRKTQRFNVKSAGATSTMLLFAVIAAFGPTLFYKIYGSHELVCYSCSTLEPSAAEPDRDCRRCFFRQTPALTDPFFVEAVRPYCWFAAVMLFVSYIIGLLFTLRTHAAVIWSTDIDEKRPAVGTTGTSSPLETRRQSNNQNAQMSAAPSPFYMPSGSIRDSALYKRILGQSLKQVTNNANAEAETSWDQRSASFKSPLLRPKASDPGKDSVDIPHLVPPKSGPNGHANIPGMPTLTEEENQHLATYVAEVAATAAAVAARDAAKGPGRAAFSAPGPHSSGKASRPGSVRQGHGTEPQPTPMAGEAGGQGAAEAGGHDAPNWSRTKSSVILCGATLAYALVAEILVNTVDVVLESVDIDEKFLGITLFALVPNTTEFLNAISFAMNGNIALSMEIGSAYALQVCLLQIPALVLFSAITTYYIDPAQLIDHTFSLIFPQFDMVTVILCVFLLSYMSSEGKSNYFKGGILILTYLVVIMGFYFSGYTRFAMGVDPDDTLAVMGGPRMAAVAHREL